jgi:hypothetical protein
LATLDLPRRYRRVVQLELNEISRDLVLRMVSRGLLPTFRRLFQEWTFIETVSEDRYDLLEPWIQWTSAHTGEPFSGHRIFRLSDADSLAVPQIWEVLSQHGMESAVIGSLNAVRGEATGGIFFPDPWSKNGITYPRHLQGLWDLISRKVLGHATSAISLTQSLRGLGEMLRLRLPAQVYQHIASQIVRQLRDPKSRWRLASAFDQFLTALFLRTLQETRFGFYTLFLNSVAHYQHHYWRNHERQRFRPDIQCPDCHTEDDPVGYGYQQFDRMLGKILERAQDEETLIIIASGLSQIPFTEREAEGGMNYYRLKDHAAFVQRVGLSDLQVFPLMSRDWQVRANTTVALERALTVLRGLQVSGEPLFRIQPGLEGHVFIETAITRSLPDEAVVTGADVPPFRFAELFARIAVKSGHHHDRGSVWVSVPKTRSALPPRMPVWGLFDLTLHGLLGRSSTRLSLEQPYGIRA